MNQLSTRHGTRARRRPEAQLSGRVVELVEQLIREGSVSGGDRLSEAALAARLGISRAPVREALRALEGRGLVTMIANRGAFVRELSIKEMLDVFDLRALLFGYGAQLAADLMDDQRKATLEGLLVAMDKAARSNDGGTYHRLNAQYHATILHFANNHRALAMYRGLESDLSRFRGRYFEFTGNMRKSNAEHRDVFDAIVSGAGEQARAVAEQHVRQGKLRVLQSLDVELSPSFSTIDTGDVR